MTIKYETTVTYRFNAEKYAYDIFDEASVEELELYDEQDWDEAVEMVLKREFSPKWADLEEQLIYETYSDEMIGEVTKVLMRLQEDWKASREDS